MKNDSSSPVRFTFKKEERLSRKKLIDELFDNGSSFYFNPFRVFYLEKKSESYFPVQVLMAVSAKTFRRAVDRNKIKRLMRESYRTNKHLLYESLRANKKQFIIALVYSGKKIESFHTIEICVRNILKRLADAAAEKNTE